MPDKDPRKKLREMIKDIRVAMLTTVDNDGELRSRPMWATEMDEDDQDLWFFTHASSHKADEISRDGHVNLGFSNPDDQNYVSVSGHAQIVRDRDKAKALWREPFRTWFPEGTDDPDMALLRVTPSKAEYWDSPSSAMVHLFGYIKSVTTGRPPTPGENEKVRM
jgi:general stress protein 26